MEFKDDEVRTVEGADVNLRRNGRKAMPEISPGVTGGLVGALFGTQQSQAQVRRAMVSVHRHEIINDLLQVTLIFAWMAAIVTLALYGSWAASMIERMW